MHARNASLLSSLIFASLIGCGGGGSTNTSADGATDGSTGGDGSTGDTGGPTDGATSIDSAVTLDAATDATPDAPATSAENVLMFHKHATRDGLYLQPTLTKTKAGALTRDASFDGTTTGKTWAQPLFVDNAAAAGGAHGMFIVVTDVNDVIALDELTGKPLWTKSMGPSAAQTGAGCGNVKPLGITSTPFVDLASNTLYVVNALGTDATPASTIKTYMAHALSLVDGSEKSGWPVDISAVKSGTIAFSPTNVQNQRGALLVQNGTLYVPFGGHYGDCGPYHAWVVGIDVSDPTKLSGWASTADGGGIWAVGGPSSDGTDVFATTGNTKGAATWGGGEAVLRFPAVTPFSGTYDQYWAPTNWKELDRTDLDIGGTGSTIVDLPSGSPSKLVMAMGKDGNIYLLDRTALPGIGAPVSTYHASSGELTNAPAIFTTSAGTFVAFRRHDAGVLLGCTNTVTNPIIGIAQIVPGTPPSIKMGWCANMTGLGSPMVTMSDVSGTDAIVWAEGAEGSELLYGWDASTGAVVFGGGGAAGKLGRTQHFTTPVAVKGRIFVGSNGKLNAFK